MILYIARKTPIPLSYIIYEAPHSIAQQSYEDPYLPGIKQFPEILKRNPKINMDGFGIYYVDVNELERIQCTKSKYPIVVVDQEKLSIGILLRTNLYKSIRPLVDKEIIYNMSFIRNNNFKEVNPNLSRDVQPYKYGNYLFCHNGGFNTEYSKYTSKLSKYIDPVFLAKMQHINIDSMWIFGLLFSQINTSASSNTDIIRTQVERFLSIMHEIKDIGFNISLNILLSDLDQGIHLALRYRTCKQVPPAMYYNKVHPLGYFVASEPLDFEDGWHLMHNQLIVIRPGICKDKGGLGNQVFTSFKLDPQEIQCE